MRVAKLRTELGEPPPDAIDTLGALVCDGCGYLVDLSAEPMPDGWTTTGGFATGFRDLCRRCSGVSSRR